MRRRPSILRLAVFVATTVAAWGVLAFGGDVEDPGELQVGDIARRDYEVVNEERVLDTVRYEAAREAAANAVDPVAIPRPEVEEQVLDRIDGFFAEIREAVVAAP
ncbi:MAG TPA: hypothetical protein VK088_11375, partial [Acidimicrobiia bacterium]|nr:hypothetical protein [Acidimicrobiia bacterium]